MEQSEADGRTPSLTSNNICYMLFKIFNSHNSGHGRLVLHMSIFYSLQNDLNNVCPKVLPTYQWHLKVLMKTDQNHAVYNKGNFARIAALLYSVLISNFAQSLTCTAAFYFYKCKFVVPAV
ncbi:hypothetical protein LOTGIDRAFT_153865 [Lottia gigantea]|uniref:Uncharacterized protein n=1 Tax=Lottia gigantea TaxID=225164 RepID=V3ZJH4_LOTGI|nr:hypothetical protein LOTGIDRAFT_153865 [Lottia gigantea]ESO91423.1 hypothetical protein LOTGIDRAFT_153865 [Lottia gigantea]